MKSDGAAAETVGWKRLYRWPMNLGLLVISVWISVVVAMLLAIFAVAPFLLLGLLSPYLALAACVIFFGLSSLALYRIGTADKSRWFLRLGAPVFLLVTIFWGGSVMVELMDESLAGNGQFELVAWAIVDSVPLLDLDRMLAFEVPLDDWSASVGWVLVLVRIAVLVFLVRVVVDTWKWTHRLISDRGLASTRRAAAAGVLRFLDAPMNRKEFFPVGDAQVGA